MTGVIFATRREAVPFLALAGQERIQDGTPAVFGRGTRQGMITLVSGMGPAAAAAAARAAI